MARAEDVKTPLAIAAFTDSLFEPQVDEKTGKKSWTVSLLFSKTTGLDALKANALAAAKEEWGDKAEGWIKDGTIKNPFLDGDGKSGKSKKTGEPHAGFPGTTFIRCKSGEKYRPKLVNKKVLPITSQDELPSGSKVYGVVNAFTWENDEQGKGITFGISLLQVAKVAEGDEVLGGGGGANPDEHFEKIEDEGDAPASTKAGAGAGGLFG